MPVQTGIQGLHSPTFAGFRPAEKKEQRKPHPVTKRTSPYFNEPHTVGVGLVVFERPSSAGAKSGTPSKTKRLDSDLRENDGRDRLVSHFRGMDRRKILISGSARLGAWQMRKGGE